MRVPAQTAPATRTTTDPWSSGSTVGIFQVRDSDGIDLKGMGWDSVSPSACIICMHMLRACLLTAQSLYSRLHGQINQRIPYVCLSRACLVCPNQSVPSLSCLDKPISVFLTSVRPEPPACALAFLLAAMLLRSRFCAPLPPFLLAIALSVSTCSFFLLFLLLRLLCLICLRFSHQCDAAKASYL
jgi:hypothetical protein